MAMNFWDCDYYPGKEEGELGEKEMKFDMIDLVVYIVFFSLGLACLYIVFN